MVSKEQRRNELARAKLARQQARREAEEAKRRRLAIIAAAVAVLLVVGGITFLSLRNNGEDTVAATTPSVTPTASTTAKPVKGKCAYVPDATTTATVTAPPDGKAATLTSATVTMATSQGEIVLELEPATAPCTVQSFVSLAQQGYFNGTTCHRLTTGEGLQVLQCGDPTGTGSGGPGYSFADETSDDMTYPRGTVAMANAGADTNGSQFFLVYGDSQLPPDYTVFGQITSGLDVLDKVAAAGVVAGGSSDTDGAPAATVDLTSVTVKTGS